MIREMYDCFGPQTLWATCFVCWKAWYSVSPPACGFTQPGAKGTSPAVNDLWFALRQSVVLTHWGFEEAHVGDTLPHEYLEANHEDQAEEITAQLVEWQQSDASSAEKKTRDIKICRECAGSLDGTALVPKPGSLRRCDFVIDPVWVHKMCGVSITHERWEEQDEEDAGQGRIPILGQRLAVIAPALHALTDFEEMVLSLVHPLVQVYTVPSTGELAYVGHICNFRQHVSKFLSSLPTLPKHMPFVLVRPRCAKGQSSKKRGALHKVDVPRLRRAFDWLKENNVYYRDVTWDPASEAEWKSERYDLPGREEDIPTHMVIQAADFQAWMSAAAVDEETAGPGFQIGRKLREWLLFNARDGDL